MGGSALRVAALVVLAVLIGTTASRCQPSGTFGFKIGLVYANQRQDFAGGYLPMEWRTGFDVGAFARVFDDNWFGVNGEVHFVRKGSAFPDIPITTAEYPDGTGELVKVGYNFDYVSASILPRAHVSLGAVEVYCMAGPRVDMLVHRAASIDAPPSILSTLRSSFDAHLRHYKDVEFGGDFAVGCHVDNLLPLGFGAEVRYSPDFTSCFEVPGGTITNRSWEFLLVVSL
jgi:hypothetical protein